MSAPDTEKKRKVLKQEKYTLRTVTHVVSFSDMNGSGRGQLYDNVGPHDKEVDKFPPTNDDGMNSLSHRRNVNGGGTHVPYTNGGTGPERVSSGGNGDIVTYPNPSYSADF